MIYSSLNMFILHTFNIHILLFLETDVSVFLNMSVANTTAYASLVTEHIFLGSYFCYTFLILISIFSGNSVYCCLNFVNSVK